MESRILLAFVLFSFSSVCRIMVLPVAARSPPRPCNWRYTLPPPAIAPGPGSRTTRGPHRRVSRVSDDIALLLVCSIFCSSHALVYLVCFISFDRTFFVVRIKRVAFPSIDFFSRHSSYSLVSPLTLYLRNRSSSYLPRRSQLRRANPTLLLPCITPLARITPPLLTAPLQPISLH